MNETGKTPAAAMSEGAIQEKYLRANAAKLKTSKILTVLMIIAALAISWRGSDFSFFVKNTNKNTSVTVYDNAEVLTDSAVNIINARNQILSEKTGGKEVKIVVVTEKDRSSYNDLKKRADKLFKDYQVSDNGMLFIVSIYESDGWWDAVLDGIDDLVGGGTQPYAYHKGRNLNEFYDSEIKGVFRDNFINGKEYNDLEYKYKTYNYSDAVLDAFNALADRLDDYYGVNSKMPDAFEIIEIDRAAGSPSGAYVAVAGVIFLFGILFIVLGLVIKKNNPAASKVYKKPFWFGMF